MLQHLSIRNYALIDRLELDWPNGFTVVTGETGAGKSIILGALSLILGKRADLKSVRNTDEKCIVEGTFKLNIAEYEPFFKDNDLDFDEISIIRREISPSGKSRSFINDTPVTLDILEELTQRLIDVHSQHQNLLLNNTSFQLQLLDSFADNGELKSRYANIFNQYRGIKKELENLIHLSENESGDSDYLQFLFNEMEETHLKAGEQEEIEEKLRLAESAGDVQSGLGKSVALLDNDGSSVLSALKHAESILSGLRKFDVVFGEWQERVESCRIELDDLRLTMEERLSELDADPEEITRLDSRLSQLLTLQKKHQVQTVEELLERKQELEQKILELSDTEEKITELRKEEEKISADMHAASAQLHESRIRVVPQLQSEIEALLGGLNMADAAFEIAVLSTEEYTTSGNDKVEFRFSANRGQGLSPLSKVASGGELSRVMLALKAILARTRNLPSIIFDEIDSGVSGETAGKIGGILRNMGSVMQVMAISHLPQIASLGQHHYKVEKESSNKQTFTRIRKLDEEEQIDELARLLSGDKVSDAARENARELRRQTG
ncbi:MAG: DNA repair protein RecN [Owenweeksia sp.]|nr:DNA repair protein RecN [Owenweeksia sp.]MBF98857.1 DNA repair protein RecN [Owenweeksia sp.]|tara:strand:+ start:7570 stop:9231 length:1662 start_codon:yes stop_codon:yes gene_type:complete